MRLCAACCAAHAAVHLDMAFQQGYTNFANAAKDPDLANVRKLNTFKPLLKQFEKNPRQPSREVLGQVVAMCDVCAEVLASTSSEAEKKTTHKNLCEQCRHNKAVLKAVLPDGTAMKLCSECSQSVSPGGNTPAAAAAQQPPPPSTAPSVTAGKTGRSLRTAHGCRLTDSNDRRQRLLPTGRRRQYVMFATRRVIFARSDRNK